MLRTNRSQSKKKSLWTSASKSLLYVLFGAIIFHTNWLETYSTRPRWFPSAVPDKTVADMKRDLRVWGLMLVAIGIIGIMSSGFMDPVWGIVLVVFGASAMGIQERSMFIPIGMALLMAGVINLSAGEFGIWTVFGLLMIILGAQEIRTVRRYASAA